ncbi:Cof-type HAD-IIB family hydrolase [Domibacillus sp. DTU_2020_1001157_1_SI_ALB_TIR_016]|uniref:Cof-type HAD-IIB family hydrolase n=1 Tax=Domibacillus sp. DTU_2020_1001157_1_SI_ALB_TIR_016 TaxID=3077789 RepID=UPI0028E8E844|nr:Cof-type HAD-IIB family hydrolase [Domibacillus sp. DTU_2020_1001157_1_SI_ALB_TIR_016]WNS77826.1 Cof-type HAD-IIB family hydrolase [Domibacillus sp. DTU_2020_1001157_1_SI_ALB_TIR_016]
MKLIAIDLDGTLLSPEMEITKENIEALRKAQSQGNIVMICSGRAPEDIQQILKKYEISCPLAGSNGTVVQVNESVLESISLDRKDIIKIAEKLDEDKVPYRVYTNHGIYVPADWSERVAFAVKKDRIEIEGLPDEVYQRITEQPQKSSLIKYFNKYSELFNEEDLTVQKFFVLTLNSTTKTALSAYLGGISSIVITSSGPLNIEVMDQNGNKGNALKRVAEYYGIPLDNTVAIGDNFNDVPMLELAGLSIAMGNADPLVKEMCDRVTHSNDKNGVAHAIDRYILSE